MFGLPTGWLSRARLPALFLLAMATLIAAPCLGIWGAFRLLFQVLRWIRDAVWLADPLGVVVPSPQTGLKGVDLLIQSVSGWAQSFIDQCSVGGAYIIAAVVTFVMSIGLLALCEAEYKADRLRAKQRR